MTALQPINGATHRAPSTTSPLAQVKRGRLTGRPVRVILYGADGVGKSTFASQAPAPVFLCAEDGTAQLDVARLPEPGAWSDVLDSVKALTFEAHDFRTLVIDTLDWLEPLCWREVCRLGGKRNIEDFPYGKGFASAVDIWRDLILQIQAMSVKRGMNLVALAHSHVKRLDDPVAGPYDRHALKLHERTAALWRESVDAVLFARVQVFTKVVDKRTEKTRAFGDGSRVVMTSPTAGFDAKSRLPLEAEIPLEWAVIQAAADGIGQRDPNKLIAELRSLMPKLIKVDAVKAEKLNKWLLENQSTDALLLMLDKTRTIVALQSDEEEKELCFQSESTKRRQSRRSSGSRTRGQS